MLPLLSLLIFIPIFSSLIISFIDTSYSAARLIYAKYVAFLGSLFVLIGSLYLLMYFDNGNTNFQFVEDYEISRIFQLRYYLGVDHISILFIFLTAILISLSLLVTDIKDKNFLIFFLVLESLIIGAFSALNLVLFYAFFEAILIPMYFIIGIWGGENRILAATKFFIYTLAGSIIFLLVIIYFSLVSQSLNVDELYKIIPALSLNVQKIICVALFVAFAVKVPMLPFHTWLPDAHVEAPTAGSVILAGILLKLGAYAFIRFMIPIVPEAVLYFQNFIIILSIVAIIYASLLAYSMDNMKKMIAYSSIAHMGYVIAGIFSLTKEGLAGALFQMFSHGIVSPALFLVVGSLYERGHTKEIHKFGGVASKMPSLAIFFLVFVMASVGLPTTSGFIGEFLCILSLVKVNYIYSMLAALGVTLGAIYMLKLYKDIMLGQPRNSIVQNFSSLQFSENLTFSILCIFVIVLGIKPALLLEIFNNSILLKTLV